MKQKLEKFKVNVSDDQISFASNDLYGFVVFNNKEDMVSQIWTSYSRVHSSLKP